MIPLGRKLDLDMILNNWLPLDGKRCWYRIPFATPKIMCVAVVTLPIDWRVYVDAVPGHNHDNEWHDVAHFGGQCSEAYAKLWFPEMPDGLEYDER